jgi:hypothetical protein
LLLAAAGGPQHKGSGTNGRDVVVCSRMSSAMGNVIRTGGRRERNTEAHSERASKRKAREEQHGARKKAKRSNGTNSPLGAHPPGKGAGAGAVRARGGYLIGEGRLNKDKDPIHTLPAGRRGRRSPLPVALRAGGPRQGPLWCSGVPCAELVRAVIGYLKSGMHTACRGRWDRAALRPAGPCSYIDRGDRRLSAGPQCHCVFLIAGWSVPAPAPLPKCRACLPHSSSRTIFTKWMKPSAEGILGADSQYLVLSE